jgi:hypothetical protein
MNGSRAKRLCAAAAFSLVVLAALTGGAGTGAAGGTTLTLSLDELGGIGSITAGGTVGYAASVENTGTATVSHVSFIVDTAGVGTYRASQVTDPPAEAITCGQGPTASSMVCKTSQLAPGDGFTVSVAFSTPGTPGSLVATASATVSANTNGRPGNPGTSTWFSEPFTTELMAATGAMFRSFSLPDDAFGAGGSGLTTAVDLPPAFLNGHFGLVTEASVFSGDALCDKCPTVFSGLSIPASLVALTNPFSASSSYSMTLKLGPEGQPPGYKFTGISHLGDEEGAEWEPVPLCTSPTDVVPGPICLDGLPSKNKKSGEINATVRGFENGSLGYD